MIDSALVPDFWTSVAIFVVLYLVKWRLDPLYHIPTVGGTSLPLLSYIGARKFVHRGKDIIREGYQKHYGKAFKVPMLDKWMVFVSGPEVLDDIRRRPDEEVSFAESVEDDMQLRHIIDRDAVENPYHVDMIREKLTRSLPVVLPHVIDELQLAVPEHIPAVSGEWTEVNVLDAFRQIIARASSRVFVGQPLCRNEEYLALSIRFAIDIMKDRDTLSWFPQFLKPYVSLGYSLARRSLSRNKEILQPAIDERAAMMERWGDDWTDKPNDMLQWFMEAQQTDDQYKTIADRIMITNFAAIHTSSQSGSLSLLWLADHPEYIDPIRKEIEEVLAEQGWTKAAMSKMWKLDSLLKEYQRHQGLSLASLSRKMMKDITLRDGTVLPRGTTIVATTYDIHHNGAKYENPDVFDPFRFSRVRADSEEERVKNQFVNTSVDYMPFGHGKHACPGRFFAANELKALLAYIILNYDFKMGDDGHAGPPSYNGLLTIPAVNATVQFRKRESKV
ncbi:Ent-kaurene oxidase [Trametes pubescens]|uniref:Ent-kaurene oxidase n=1 Tax=Trametes pubescens TaxID=154538 RepID=A0A1M2W3M0_TRAPU|nr:Ent-kaurene oxidase [Trametes pubescens]